jgi:uncharacterized phosphosugar-binding protein
MDNLRKYIEIATKAMKDTLETEEQNIDKVAELMCEQIMKDNLIHVFGTGGHSIMAGEEMFARAGGLVHINAILYPGISLASGSMKCKIERVPGIAEHVLNSYVLNPGELMIINNVAGLNAMTIDAALECKKRGLTVVGLVSKEFAQSVPAGHVQRHPSNKNLQDIADIVIDMKVPVGDAVIEVDGCDQKLAPISTIVISFVVHALTIRTVEKLVERGFKPPVWRSGNIPGGDEANMALKKKYLGRIKHM